MALKMEKKIWKEKHTQIQQIMETFLCDKEDFVVSSKREMPSIVQKIGNLEGTQKVYSFHRIYKKQPTNFSENQFWTKLL